MKKDFQITMSAPAISAGAAVFTPFVILHWNSASNLIFLRNSNETYSHGFLIPFLSVYLITQRNKLLTVVTLKPIHFISLPLALTLSLWLIASITDIPTIELTLLPLIFIFSYLGIIGYRFGIILIAPLLYINELNNIADYHLISSSNSFIFNKQEIFETIVDSDNSKERLVWYWYNVNNRDATKRLTAKALQFLELFSENPNASLTALSTECNNRCAEERGFLNKHIKPHHQQIISAI